MRAKPWRDAASLMLFARKAATTKSNFDYQLLMLQRSNKSPFMPSAYVFPGGVTSTTDCEKEWLVLFRRFGGQRSVEDVVVRPGIKRPLLMAEQQQEEIPRDLSFRISALRETFEESGIFLHCGGNEDSKKVVPSISDLAEYRPKVNKDPKQFLRMCQDFQVCPDVWSLYEWRAWLTPLGRGDPGNRRFDTIFYGCVLDKSVDELSASMDEDEVTDVCWADPKELLNDCKEETLWLAPPQVYELTKLLDVRHLEDVMKICKLRQQEGVSSWMPVFKKCSDGVLGILPGDELYPEEPDYLGNATDVTIEKTTAGQYTIAEAEKSIKSSDCSASMRGPTMDFQGPFIDSRAAREQTPKSRKSADRWTVRPKVQEKESSHRKNAEVREMPLSTAVTLEHDSTSCSSLNDRSNVIPDTESQHYTADVRVISANNLPILQPYESANFPQAKTPATMLRIRESSNYRSLRLQPSSFEKPNNVSCLKQELHLCQGPREAEVHQHRYEEQERSSSSDGHNYEHYIADGRIDKPTQGRHSPSADEDSRIRLSSRSEEVKVMEQPNGPPKITAKVKIQIPITSTEKHFCKEEERLKSSELEIEEENEQTHRRKEITKPKMEQLVDYREKHERDIGAPYNKEGTTAKQSETSLSVMRGIAKLPRRSELSLPAVPFNDPVIARRLPANREPLLSGRKTDASLPVGRSDAKLRRRSEQSLPFNDPVSVRRQPPRREPHRTRRHPDTSLPVVKVPRRSEQSLPAVPFNDPSCVPPPSTRQNYLPRLGNITKERNCFGMPRPTRRLPNSFRVTEENNGPSTSDPATHLNATQMTMLSQIEHLLKPFQTLAIKSDDNADKTTRHEPDSFVDITNLTIHSNRDIGDIWPAKAAAAVGKRSKPIESHKTSTYSVTVIHA